MVKGYKTINIKEELIQKIRNLEENKKEVEEGRFNLAGFFVNAALEHISNKETARTVEPLKKEGLTIAELREVLKEILSEKKERGNVATTDINAGLTQEDLAAIKGVVGEAIAEVMH